VLTGQFPFCVGNSSDYVRPDRRWSVLLVLMIPAHRKAREVRKDSRIFSAFLPFFAVICSRRYPNSNRTSARPPTKRAMAGRARIKGWICG